MTGTLPYEQLIRSERLRSSDQTDRTISIESQSDKGRLIFSAPFRRLQQKAQVFSLESNAAVRSRLTHTFEVAYLGRLIAVRVIQKLRDGGGQDALHKLGLDEGRQFAFVDFVETGCLAHDIGNPPFGHFGEHAIQRWFEENGSKYLEDSLRVPPETAAEAWEKFKLDFLYFDGNAQGVRILTRLQWHLDSFGLNLTCSQLASMIKYPRAPGGELDIAYSTKNEKIGFFHSEEPLIKEVWNILQLENTRRYPLVYLVEAADDIAYCLSDIEDGIEKRVITESDFFSWMNDHASSNSCIQEALDKSLRKLKVKNDSGESCSSGAKFSEFKICLTRKLVEAAADHYVQEHCQILAGDLTEVWNENQTECEALDLLKNFARAKLYSSEEAQRTELAGYRAILGLLDHLSPLLELSKQDFESLHETEKKPKRKTDLHRRLFRLLPEKHVLAYHHLLSSDPDKNPEREWYHRAHLLVDYVSGMTDGFSVEMYQLLSGIRL